MKEVVSDEKNVKNLFSPRSTALELLLLRRVRILNVSAGCTHAGINRLHIITDIFRRPDLEQHLLYYFEDGI